jgi:phosphoribosylanthranilate isomerase
MTIVKICGLTNLDDARCAAEAGADLLGFVFYPPSRRFTPPERVAEIVRALRDELGASAPRCVGVFVDESLERVRATLGLAGLDLAQLHGAEPPSVLRALAPRAFKAIRPQTPAEAEESAARYSDCFLADPAAPQLLLDAYHPDAPGGTGLQANLEAARRLAGRFRLLLAGGLTPETVAAVVEQVRPWGVDVSSGVERPGGGKDPARVRAFVRAVRAIALS